MLPSLNSKEVGEISTLLVDWYWKHGRLRQGNQALGVGTWLDQVYRIRSVAGSIRSAQNQKKLCHALWGPSQSGKSTLLSRYLDQPAEDFVSALQWSPHEPVLFLGRKDAPSGCIALNPYQGKADASGCVSRFVLEEDVPDPEHPIELRLATEQQILLALSIGYLTECDTRNKKKEELFLDEEKFSALLEGCDEAGSFASNRAAYERLHELTATLDDLVFAGWPRYRNLSGKWDSLRTRLLETPGLLTSVQTVDALAGQILWDNHDTIANLYQQLCQQRKKINGLTKSQPIFCSYRAAAMFLNIAAYRQLTESGKDRDKVIGFRASLRGSRFTIGAEGDLNAFHSDEDFGLWQGLVWELIVPVNKSVLAKTSPVASEFLKRIDLLDFPGVALQYQGGVKLSADQISQENLLTEVLKRGKTASIVATRSKQLEILGFSILNRFQEPPAQPDQLITGIQAWTKHLGTSTEDRDLPLSLILTFGAQPVNAQIHQLRIKREPIDFSSAFSWLEKLGPLADPSKVRFFATTYTHLPQGKIEGTNEEIESATKLIIQSNAFKHWFRYPETFLHMVGSGVSGDGGTDYLLQKLTEQTTNSKIANLLALREKQSFEELQTLLVRALPTDPNAARAQELEDWKLGISEVITSQRQNQPGNDAAHDVGYRLRKLLNVEPELLEAVPQQTANRDVHEYIVRQFRRWVDYKIAQQRNWHDFGLRDKMIASRVLGYFCEYAVRHGGISSWLRENFGHLTSKREASHARRFIAIKMADILCFGPDGKSTHRLFSPGSQPKGDINSEFVDIRLRGYADNDVREACEQMPQDSPHYRAFIDPLLQHIDSVKKVGTGARPDQPGDEEIRKLQSILGMA